MFYIVRWTERIVSIFEWSLVSFHGAASFSVSSLWFIFNFFCPLLPLMIASQKDDSASRAPSCLYSGFYAQFTNQTISVTLSDRVVFKDGVKDERYRQQFITSSSLRHKTGLLCYNSRVALWKGRKSMRAPTTWTYGELFQISHLC